jgi:restriction endonuclease S subunit
MQNFSLSTSFNKNRVFLLRKSEVEKRLDPFYYVPDVVGLEKKLLAKQPKRLRDYAISLASGATPKTTESELYYTNKDNGLPFLRVQNLSPTGVLEFDDCKYINKATHEGYLKRSQVFENDLLVKITGVGRMAVSSVAPYKFEGNINQHIVVIRTKDEQNSKTIAAFLNSDIGEKLATRRSTGGTRPALDYPALLSIPILYDTRILHINQIVVEQKKLNETQAAKLLSSIDDYLLKELGITLPEPPDNCLQHRMFKTNIKEITGGRFDPFYNNPIFSLINIEITKTHHNLIKVKDVFRAIRGVTFASTDVVAQGLKVLRANNIDLKTNELVLDDVMQVSNEMEFNDDQKLFENDILMSAASGSKEHVGKVAFIESDMDLYFGGFMMVLRLKIGDALPRYLFEYLQSKIFRTYLFRLLGGTNINNLNFNMMENLLIPLPTIEKQKEIVEHNTIIRRQARELKDKTKVALEQANKDIEKILLG